MKKTKVLKRKPLAVPEPISGIKKRRATLAGMAKAKRGSASRNQQLSQDPEVAELINEFWRGVAEMNSRRKPNQKIAWNGAPLEEEQARAKNEREHIKKTAWQAFMKIAFPIR